MQTFFHLHHEAEAFSLLWLKEQKWRLEGCLGKLQVCLSEYSWVFWYFNNTHTFNPAVKHWGDEHRGRFLPGWGGCKCLPVNTSPVLTHYSTAWSTAQSHWDKELGFVGWWIWKIVVPTFSVLVELIYFCVEQTNVVCLFSLVLYHSLKSQIGGVFFHNWIDLRT